MATATRAKKAASVGSKRKSGSAGKRPIEEFYQSGRMVIPLTLPVKRFIAAYMELFDTQREAADAAGVDLSTINNYATAYKNMAVNVFDRMARVMASSMSGKQIARILGGRTLDDLRALAKKQNGAWVDHVMYTINDGLLMILKSYTTPFRSREEAGLALGLNARTYTAYLKGQIQCFPRKYFWLVIEKLKERGLDEKQILRIASASRWEDFLEEKQRASTLDLSQEEVLERMIMAIMNGKLKKKDLEPAFLNAVNRTFGNFGEAVLRASQKLADRASKEITATLANPGMIDSVLLLNRYAEYYKRCRRSLEFIRRARKEDERGEIDGMLLRFQRTLVRMEKLVNQKAKTQRLILVGGVNGGFVYGTTKPGAESNFYQLAKEYGPDKRFMIGDLIYHGGLGLGEVVTLKDDTTIVVQFSDSKKTVLELAQNRPSFYRR